MYVPNKLAAVKAGIAKKKEILAASNLLKPRNLPVVIVIPDLLTPGINDIIWNNPKIIADLYDKDKLPYLKRANVDTIILKDEFESNMISAQISNPGVPEALNMLMNIYEKNGLKSIKIPKEFINKEFYELKKYLYEKNKFLCIGIYNEKENLGFSDFLSSDNSGIDAFIEKKLEKSGHSLEKGNNTHIKLNPENNYIIKKNEGAIVIS